MLKITVQRDGTGDFTTISEAVLAVPYECEAEIEIGPGIYREKLSAKNRTSPSGGPGPTRPASCGKTAASCPTRTAGRPIRSAATPRFSAAKISLWKT